MRNAATGDPCLSHVVLGQHGQKAFYHSPLSIANLMSVAGDEWVVVQMYKLVTGSTSISTHLSWDCTSPDWTQHWTGEMERAVPTAIASS